MDEMQAAFLSIKLADLNSDTEIKREYAEYYLKTIDNPKIILPCLSDHSSSAWHLFVIRTNNRYELKEYLENLGIKTLIHYPIPPHKQKAFSEWNHLSYPITEKIHNEVLSIPLYPLLSAKERKYIVNAINKY